ncbi:MAG: GDP-mannose 4,6-dehydratase [Kiritimatiellae bacterium]|nr:GDP-mannose 4,6-dehydratase [Kiritimatiellia bacterium]MDD5521301.1 GDP-mannose 4,6-dehydratase [Kiritimatiellia bacterium]
MQKKHKIRKVLITGITGSGGSYLADYIVQNHSSVKIHGISRWHSTTSNHNLENSADCVEVHECDLMDFSAVFSVLKSVQPDTIFHLASHANVRASFTNPLAVMRNNIEGTANILEAIRLAEIDPVVQLCSTSEVYGQVFPEEVPIKETQALRPSSPYAVSKVTQDLLGYTYFRSYGMKIIRTRMFAYLNPRRADLFATSFARQIARIEAGMQKELVHGNLDSVRTLIDVRDAMEAYWVAALHCEPGEAYNIGGSFTVSVGQFLEMLKTKAKKKIRSRVEKCLLRPADVTLQLPDVSKFLAATGWKPKHDIHSSIDLLLNYWRTRVRNERYS